MTEPTRPLMPAPAAPGMPVAPVLAPAASPEPDLQLKLSPTLQRIRAQRQAELENSKKAAAASKAEAAAPAPTPATATATAPAPSAEGRPAAESVEAAPASAGAPATPNPEGAASSVWLSNESPLLKPLPASTAPQVLNVFGTIPMGALGTGALLLAGASGLGSSSKGGASPAPGDTTAPVLRSAKVSDDGTKLVLDYSEALSSTSALPDKANFAVTIDGVSTPVTTVARGSNGSSVELTLASRITSAPTVSVSLADSATLRDTAGNVAATFKDQVATVTDKTAPSLLSSTAITGANSSVIVLRYSEPLLASAKPAPGDFAVKVNNTAVTVSAVDVLGDSVRLTLASPIASPGTANVQLGFTQPGTSSQALQDAAGNLVASILDAGGIRVSSSGQDLSPPTVDSATGSATLGGLPSRLLRLTFSEALDAGALPDVASLSVQLASGGSSRSIGVSSLKISGSVLELSLAETVSDAQAGLRLSYTPPASGPALQDWASNDVAAFTRGVGLGDLVPPALASSRFTSANTLELTFTEPLGGLGPDKSNFSLLANDGAPLKATTSSISGRTLTLTWDAAVQTGKAATLSYSAPASDASPLNLALQDTAGNDAASFSQLLDTTAPTLVSASTGGDGLSVRLFYNDSLLSPSSSATPAIPAVPASAFKVFKSLGVEVSVSSVTVSGNEVSLTLASALSGSDTVSVFYVPPISNIGVANAALQDSTGNDAAALGSGVNGQAVSNKVLPTVTRAVLDSLAVPLDTVVLSLSEAPAGAAPDKSAFNLSLGGVAQTLRSVSISGSNVLLTLDSPLASDGAVLLSYNPPSSNALQDSEGNRLAALTQSLGQVKTGTAAADTLSGQAGLSDYFLGSAGNDVLSGLGGSDTFVWPDFGAAGPGGFAQTLKDFGFRKGSGTLQGSSEADLLDLRHLLDGYTSASTPADFLRFAKNGDGKLVLNIDRDGGASFSPTASLLFDNVTVDAQDRVLAGAQFVSHNSGNLSLADVLTHLMAEKQLSVL